MSATGASPIYYDFDMLQEMSVTTGGADASQQTGGVGINFVARSGTNRFKGSGRLYNTNERFEADNVDEDLRKIGAGSGNLIQNINDYGFEVGGPIKKNKLWLWGSYGKQKIEVGVLVLRQDRHLPSARSRPCRHSKDPRHRHAAQPPRDRPHTVEQLQLEGDVGADEQQQVQPAEHLGGKGPQRP